MTRAPVRWAFAALLFPILLHFRPLTKLVISALLLVSIYLVLKSLEKLEEGYIGY